MCSAHYPNFEKFSQQAAEAAALYADSIKTLTAVSNGPYICGAAYLIMQSSPY